MQGASGKSEWQSPATSQVTSSASKQASEEDKIRTRGKEEKKGGCATDGGKGWDVCLTSTERRQVAAAGTDKAGMSPRRVIQFKTFAKREKERRA